MIRKLKNIYINEQFNPKILGLFINPFYFDRKGLHQHISELIKNLNGKVLDVGCGQKPYQNLCNCTEYIGLELDTPENRASKKADYYYDGKVIPFENAFFQSVFSSEVFEHVFNPNEFLKEINRVTQMEGLLLFTVPFVWDEHEQPYDYARYSSFGLQYILKENGFEVIKNTKSNNGLEVIFQMLNSYIYKITLTKNNYINMIVTILLIAPINLIGLVLSKIFPRNNDLYLSNIVLAKKICDL